MRTAVPGLAVTKMADVSLDELIRRRNFNTRGGLKRPSFGRGAGLTGRGAGSVGRGAGLMGRTFDARQKIGSTDVRQRLGGSGAFQVKDAREKLGQNDARFRIQARGGAASAVQDARQTINSRKQQQVQDSPLVTSSQTPIPHIHIQNNSSNPSSTGVRTFPTNQGLGTRVGVAIQPRGGITKVVDARDRLSLKRSVSSLPSQGSAAPLKITKTIQQRPVGMTSGIRINVPSRAAQTASNEEEEEAVVPNKQLKFTTTNDLAQTRVGGGFSVSTPITKVVKNDSYLAPPPAASAAAAAVAPTRSNPRPPAQTPENTSSQPAQPVFSPLEGTKITVNNLHPRVTEEDIVELFCVCGALKRARLVKVGVAEVVFVRKDDAISAYRKYNNRCLDGQPMKCNLHIQGSVITSDQPILLRLSDSPGKKETPSSAVSRSTPRSSSAEVDPQTILKALFKSSNQSSASTETPPPAAHSTAFRIKI
ncbi:polymerase delta-interacting protein 3 isoform X1 [Pangasianodon hypophthalmus]|uniref:polymerase delta-interacting protein 3 isoform X1 n=1 Tax=Pangasianodon hypophthalmus TaxID=310915 RepID=UPI0023081AD9|nr:polymerase delta-interacting protein 3 isoform X1 [Pangasianodon hypophthalmus]